MSDFVPYTGEVKPLASAAAPPKPEFVPYTGEVKPPAPAETSWSDVIKGGVRNAGKSFKENVIDPSMGFAKLIANPAKAGAAIAAGKEPVPGAETAKGLTKLGQAVTSFGSDPETEWGITQAELLNPGSTKDIKDNQKAAQETGKDTLGKVRDFYVKRYGSMEGFKKALMQDPIAVAMDASVFLSAGSGALAKVPGVAKATEAVGKIAGAAGRGTGELAAHVPAGLTGKSVDSIKQAAKAGFDREKEFIDSLNGKLPAEETVKIGAKSIGNMRKERNKNYQDAIKVLGENPDQVKPHEILQGWQEAQEKFGHYEGFVTSERSVGLDKKLMDVLEEWYQKGQAQPDKFYTPEGLDALKKRVRSIKNNISFEAREDRSYVGSLENYIREKISEQVPVYDKIMTDYHLASDGLEEMERALSLGDKAMYDTGIRKMLQAMRNNSNSNFGNRLKMLDTLEQYGAKGLKSRLAGMEMSAGLPSGRASHNPAFTIGGALASGHPELLAALPFQSPKLVGRGLYYGGKGARGMSDLADQVLPAVRPAPLVGAVDELAKQGAQ